MGPNRFVHLMFIAGAALLAFSLAKTGEWLLGYVLAKPPEAPIAAAAVVIGCGAALVAYRNERVFTLATEVASEIRKVTWPSRQEVRAATVVVIVTVVFFAVVLGLYDAFWSWVTSRIYS